MRHNALIEWNAAASGWKKYEKDMLRWMAPVSDQLIRSREFGSVSAVGNFQEHMHP